MNVMSFSTCSFCRAVVLDKRLHIYVFCLGKFKMRGKLNAVYASATEANDSAEIGKLESGTTVEYKLRKLGKLIGKSDSVKSGAKRKCGRAYLGNTRKINSLKHSASIEGVIAYSFKIRRLKHLER